MLAIPLIRGGVPLLTPDMMRDILDVEERLAVLSVFDALDAMSACTAVSVGFTELCGLRDFRCILSTRSPFKGAHASVASSEAGICCDHSNGRLTVTPDTWAQIVRTMRPTYAVAMFDPVAHDEPAAKRRRVALARTSKWLIRAKEDAARESPDTIVVVPSSVASEADRAVAVDSVSMNEAHLVRVQNIAAASAKDAPRNLVLCTASTVVDLLLSLLAGATVVACELPWTLADKGVALRLVGGNPGAPAAAPVQDALLDPDVDAEPPLLDLNSPEFARALQPLCHGCRCYTCARHSRAYIHHLLTVQEMNSPILLAIHNLTQMVDMLRGYRRVPVPERGGYVQRALRPWCHEQPTA